MDPNCIFKIWRNSSNFFYTHLGYSFNFTVVYLCQIKEGIPPPSGGIVGKKNPLIFRINTLYMYRHQDDELPLHFWLLDENCFICSGNGHSGFRSEGRIFSHYSAKILPTRPNPERRISPRIWIEVDQFTVSKA